MTILVLAGVVTALCGLLLQPLTIRAMTWLGVIDSPNARSSHESPIPRGGGVAVVLAATIGLTLSGAPAPLLLALTLFAVLGLAEDIYGVAVFARLCMQIGLGLLIAAATSVQVLNWPQWVLLAAIAVWLAGFVNIFNFMDGINGISAVQAIVAGLAYAAIGAVLHASYLINSGLVLAVAAATFLPWNALRPKVFLGDVGSYALGATLGMLAVLAVSAGAPVEAAGAPLALYTADTMWTLLRRARAGDDLLSAHRTHVYQRLTVLGWSHVRVTSLCGLLTAALVALSTASMSESVSLRVVADLAGIAMLCVYLSAPLVLQRSRQAAVAGSGPTA